MIESTSNKDIKSYSISMHFFSAVRSCSIFHLKRKPMLIICHDLLIITFIIISINHKNNFQVSNAFLVAYCALYIYAEIAQTNSVPGRTLDPGSIIVFIIFTIFSFFFIILDIAAFVVLLISSIKQNNARKIPLIVSSLDSFRKSIDCIRFFFLF